MAGGSARIGRCPLGVVETSGRLFTTAHPPPFFGLGAANMITISRGWLISVLAGIALIAAAKPDAADWIIWLPALLYLAIGCGDFCDGLVARLTRTESLLGKRLDMSMDALGLLVASAAAVFLKRLPPAFLLVGLSYYLFQLGLTYRRFAEKSCGRWRIDRLEGPWPAYTWGLSPWPSCRDFPQRC
jgi:phosphatidylglycerophosphate synthase